MKIRNFADVKNILFDNLTVKQTIFKNTFWMGLADGVSKFLKFILIIYVARIIGVTEYGKFNFALAFISLFVVFFNVGLSQAIIVREFAKDPKKEKEFADIFSFKIVLGLIAVILIWSVSFLITKDFEIRKLIWILAIFSLIENFSATIYSFFRARQKMEYQAFIDVLESLLIVIIGLSIIFIAPSIRNLAYGYLTGAFIAFVAALTILHFKIQPFSVSWNTNVWKSFLMMSWPLAFVSIFYQIYNQIDSVIMGYFGQITQIGWYSASSKVIGVCLIFAGLISNSFYPVLSKTFQESKDKFQRILNYQMEIMIVLAFPLMIGGSVLASKIINFMYGQEFNQSILVFQILSIMTGIIFIYTGFQRVLIIAGFQKVFLLITFLGAMTSIILNLILIPEFSLYGAAFSAVVTHLLIFLLSAKLAIKFVSIKLLNSKILVSLVGVVISSLAMYFVISYPPIYSLNVVLTILIGGGIYFSLLWGYRNTINRILNPYLNK